MMRNKTSRGPETERLQTPIPVLDLAQPTIRLKRLPLPETGLQFPPKSPLVDSRKRGRATADIDGEHSCLQKKKRRLRLFLITSRLSPQFSHPATNIVDRGSSKIAVWAKQKALGRNLLRKAAILNRIRRRAVSARGAVPGRGRLLVEQEKEQRQLEMARLTFNYGSIDTYTRPVHTQPHSALPYAAIRNGSQYLFSGSPTASPSASPTASRSPSPTSISPPSHSPLPNDSPSESRSPNAAYALSPPRMQSSTRSYEPLLPSPLGLSNYDALDVDDDAVADPYSHLDDDDDDGAFAYYWDEAVDERHDSPFSPEAGTDALRASRALKTPPPPPLQTGDRDVSVADALLGFESADADAAEDENENVDSAYPPPSLGATSKTHTKSVYGASQSNPNPTPHFPPRDPRPLAVRYPGEPVAVSESESDMSSVVTTPPAVSSRMVPACMSPNFLPAGSGVWEEKWDGRRAGRGADVRIGDGGRGSSM